MNQKIHYVKNKILETKISILIFTIIGFLTLPFPYWSPRQELDSVASVGMHESILKGFELGNDVVSPFGPLQFLLVPVISDPLLWFLSMVFRVFTHFFFLYVIVLFIVKMRINLKEYVLIMGFTVFTIMIPFVSAVNDYMILVPSVMLLYLISTNKIQNRNSYALLIGISFLLAIIGFIKFNGAIASVSLISIFSIISLINRDFKKTVVILISYCLFIGILWLISGQIIEDFPTWFSNSIDVSRGYNYGNAIDGPKIQVVLGIIGIISVISFLAYYIKKRNLNLVIFTLLSGELLFQSFKHGFVRHDLHVILFFFCFGFFFMISYIIYTHERKTEKKSTKVKIILIFLTIIFASNIVLLSAEVTIGDHFGRTHTPYAKILPWVVNGELMQHEVDITKTNLKNHYQLDDFSIDYLNGKTIDVMQWDLGLPWAYNFEWKPRPMWWSFMVFTTEIDKLNGDYFRDERKAPEAIVYSYKSIDDRYPIFDEPLALQSILKNYEYIHTSGEFSILEKKFNHMQWQEIELIKTEKKIGEMIEVPKFKEGYLFAKIDLKPNTFGKIISTAYKPALAHITFKFADETLSPTYRLIPDTAKDGLFLTQHITNLNDFTGLWSESIIQNISGFIITVDDPLQYEKSVKVSFVGVPRDILVNEGKAIEIPNWDSLKKVSGGLAIIDNVGDKQFLQKDNVFYLSSETKELFQISGWSVDNIAKDGNVKTFLILQNQENEIVFPTQKVYRQDLITALGEASYQHGGWRTTINSETLEEGCYEIILKIPRTSNIEYFEINGNRTVCLQQ